MINKVLIILGVLSFLIMSFFILTQEPSAALGAEIPDTLAIRIIVGEAADQGFIGMVAVGEVIRRNGHITAYEGLKAAHSAHEPKKVWIMASRAWQASAHTNITVGANHFDNVKEFGEPYWAPDCETTVIIKDHYFFKC